MNEIKEMLENSEINKPVSMEYLNNIEKTYGIIFPHEFKIFYSQISNGEVGVEGYELHSIDEIFKILKEKEKICETNLIDKKFQFTETYFWGEEGLYELRPEIYYGNIEIADMGCGETWNLIVNGDSYGTVWNFTEWGITPCTPNLNFFEWFKLWYGNDGQLF